MRADRLLALADFLDELKPEQLTMDQWTCGTAACAIGWYCRALSPVLIYLRPSKAHPGGYVPTSRVTGRDTNEAIAEEFDITEDDSISLFATYTVMYCQDPHVVAGGIRRFVESRAATDPTVIEMKPQARFPDYAPDSKVSTETKLDVD